MIKREQSKPKWSFSKEAGQNQGRTHGSNTSRAGRGNISPELQSPLHYTD